MSRFYEVVSEGVVVWNQDNQEVYAGRVYLYSYEHDDASPEIIATDLIIDKWGGQRIKIDDLTTWDEEFTNGTITHVQCDDITEAEDNYHAMAQLGTAPINIKDLLDE